MRRTAERLYGHHPAVRPDSSETVFRGTLFDVVAERWGEHERQIVDHPGSVAIVAVDREARVVLVRQLREPARATLLELPAGTLEEGEEPLACARRELAEETGLRGGNWRKFADLWTSPGFVRERMTVFLAEDVDEGEPHVDADESVELVRWPLAEVAVRVAELEDAKTLVGVLLLLRERGL
jgi:ADP-ribose pyrophosphatase